MRLQLVDLSFHPTNDQTHEMESELRILKVKLLQFLVGHVKNLHVGLAHAAECSSSLVREYRDLAEEQPAAGVLAHRRKMHPPRNNEVNAACGLAFCEDRAALGERLPPHVGPQPLGLKNILGLGGNGDAPNQAAHRLQAINVQRQ